MAYTSIFELLATITKQEKIPCVLIGGFAVNYYHVTRQTADADFLISEEDSQKMIGLLKNKGLKIDSQGETFIRFSAEDPYYMDVDFMLVEKETLYKIIKNSKIVNIGKQEFNVPSLLHLIALKLHSIKYNSKRQYKDLIDIVELIKSNKLDVRSNEFKEICMKYGTQQLYDKILGIFV